jgi:hypothetical protein
VAPPMPQQRCQQPAPQKKQNPRKNIYNSCFTLLNYCLGRVH